MATQWHNIKQQKQTRTCLFLSVTDCVVRNNFIWTNMLYHLQPKDHFLLLEPDSASVVLIAWSLV